ncbi:MAG: hypothetical protein MJ123_11020 [Lachnospiraceae bacterium]|nr:hypothetical protein [Lachnospiraceae bacterium]
MNAQNEFIKNIKDIVELALDQENVIFTEQLEAVFPEIKEDESKKALLTDYLKEKKIGIDSKLDIAEFITEDEKNYLDFYLEELAEIKRLTKGEREVYTKEAMAGNEDAYGILVNDYLPEVVDLAKLYVGQGVFLEDLIGEGNIALLTAVPLLGSLENHEEAEGFIGKQIMDALQDMIAANIDEMSEQEKIVNKVNKVSFAAEELSKLLGRKVTIEELSLESGISEAQIKKALKLTANKIEGIEIINE